MALLEVEFSGVGRSFAALATVDGTLRSVVIWKVLRWVNVGITLFCSWPLSVRCSVPRLLGQKCCEFSAIFEGCLANKVPGVCDKNPLGDPERTPKEAYLPNLSIIHDSYRHGLLRFL